eukprot:evm.model.scf_484.3 EVM.evm.TU.scf_484.3   scf_484:48769-49758(-)
MPSAAQETVIADSLDGVDLHNYKIQQASAPQDVLRQRRGRNAAGRPAAQEEDGGARRGPGVVFWEDAPQVLKFNRFIRSGYRAGYSYPQCLASLWGLHNETGNIWTHLLPAVALAMVALGGLERPWAHAGVAYAVTTGSIVGCFVLSVCYHCFMGCHRDYKTWLTLDVCGVYLALLGSQWIAVEWGFPCHPALRLWGNAIYYALGIPGLALSCLAGSPLRRGLPMLLMTAVRVCLLILRWAFAQGSAVAMRHYWAMEALVFVGGVVNVCRWPERWQPAPGPRKAALLDHWGNSHQIMHVCVAAGMLLVHRALGEDAGEAFRAGVECAAR